MQNQNTSDEDITFKLYNNSSQVNGKQFTLLAGESNVKYNHNVTAPILSGLDPDATYYIKCSQGATPTVKAQGVELTYILHRI